MTDAKEAAKIQARLCNKSAKMDTVKQQFARIRDFVKSQAATASVPALRARLEGLERVYANFEKIQSDLEELSPSRELADQRATLEEDYYDLKPALQVFVQLAEGSKVDESTVENHHSVIKYPKITLPEFNGDCTRWMSFIETFNTLVHKNSAFDDVARFHYLRGALKGSALRTIESIEINSENYKVAYDLLQDRYANKKLIAQEHIHRLFSVLPITKPSTRALRDLIDDVNAHLRALTSLGRPAAQWDDLIIYLISKRLDSITLEKWEEDCPSNRMPTLQEFLKSLEKRAHTLEAKANFRPNSVISRSKENNRVNKTNPLSSFKAVQGASNSICVHCSGKGHLISRCFKFLALSTRERINAVKRLQICINCLRPGHLASSCPSRHCQFCPEKHHTLLHEPASSSAEQGPSTSATFVSRRESKPPLKTQPAAIESSTLIRKNESMTPYVLLATALVDVPNKYGTLVTCRALLDSASQLNFITTHAAQLLGHKSCKTDIPISGIGATSTTSSHKMNVTIKARCQDLSYNIEAHILPKISGRQPDRLINIQNWKMPSNISLADPSFFKPNKIDLLLGTDIFTRVLEGGQIRLHDQLPSLQRTQLGWIVMGTVPTDTSVFHCNLTTGHSLSSLEKQVRQFWEIERHDAPTKCYTKEEQACEQHFQRNTKRSATGQFIVRLPVRNEISQLGDSTESSLRRFLSLERRLSRQPEVYKAYRLFMSECENLGHMTPIPSTSIPTRNCYLPHHCVQKLDSSTTKLRVVFDASAKTTSGILLNDALMVGPTVQ